MKKRLSQIILLVLVGVVPFAACSDDDDNPVEPTVTEVTINPMQDNTLYEDDTGSRSNGMGAGLFAGRTRTGGREQHPAFLRRALIKFDVANAGIPAGSKIDSVFLSLTVTKLTTIGGRVETFTIHRVLKQWGEGSSINDTDQDGTGSLSKPGDATWIHTFWDQEFWTNSGGDFDPNAVSSRDISLASVQYTWPSTSAMVDDVQKWLSDPADNRGWMVRGDETVDGSARRFASREAGITAARPQLRIKFTNP